MAVVGLVKEVLAVAVLVVVVRDLAPTADLARAAAETLALAMAEAAMVVAAAVMVEVVRVVASKELVTWGAVIGAAANLEGAGLTVAVDVADSREGGKLAAGAMEVVGSTLERYVGSSYQRKVKQSRSCGYRMPSLTACSSRRSCLGRRD